LCGINFTPQGTLTRIVKGTSEKVDRRELPSRGEGGNAGNGFQSISSGRIARKTSRPR
jgi:hypothetical protein